MNIIVEGPDNSGKSTLAEIISNILDWPILHSAGPSTSDEAFNEKARAFLSRHGTVFDRHCIVSEQIYGTARGRVRTDPSLIGMFYASSKVIIYCPGDPTDLDGHQLKAHDTPEHIRLVRSKHSSICSVYDAWALKYANIIYRKGEPPHRIVRFLKGEIGR